MPEKLLESSNSFYRDKIFHSPPLKLRLLRIYLRLLNKISKKRASRYVTRLFMFPRISRSGILEDYTNLGLMDAGKHSFVNLQEEDIFVYQEGELPEVLLIYGWESSIKRLSTLIEGLKNNNINFIGFDLPAHGLSSGKLNDAILSSKIVKDLLKKYPSIHTIVGHSFGGGVGFIALEEKSNVKTLITIGSPTQLPSVVDPFYLLLNLSLKLQEQFLDEISIYVGREFRDYDLTTIQTESTCDLLVIHDTDDSTIPYTDAERMKKKYEERCQIIITNGLGHRKIMHDPGIVAKIVERIKSSK